MLSHARPSNAMPIYRAYVLDEQGHVVAAVNLECADDEEARGDAGRLGNGDVELWRRVPLFEPENRGQESQ